MAGLLSVPNPGLRKALLHVWLRSASLAPACLLQRAVQQPTLSRVRWMGLGITHMT